MQLLVGSYAFENNATGIAVSIETLFNEAEIPYAQRRVFSVTGYFSVTGQLDCTLKENLLKTALATNFQNVTFLDDHGQLTSEILLNATSISGVRVTHGPTFDKWQGPEYATLRSFSFTVEAEYQLPNTANLLLSFSEHLDFSGGGPIRIHRRAINTVPQRQTTYRQTEYRLVQSGSLVAYRNPLPVPPPPKFPNNLMRSGDISRFSPRRRGRGYQGYGVRWSYVMESVSPLNAVPTLWVN